MVFPTPGSLSLQPPPPHERTLAKLSTLAVENVVMVSGEPLRQHHEWAEVRFEHGLKRNGRGAALRGPDASTNRQRRPF